MILPRLLITGAAGGMGRACARLLGTGHELVLTDSRHDALAAFATELDAEGYCMAAALSGDLRDPTLLASLADQVAGGPFVLVHTAGLSPSLADWREIMSVNLVASTMLLDAIEPHLVPGCVAVLVSSAAGYRTKADKATRDLVADPCAAGFLDRIGQDLVHSEGSEDLRGPSYSLSKYGVHRLCEARAGAWGKRGARIVSLSPTLTATPMGASEISHTPAAGAFISGGPVGRMATAMDVAMVVRFLIGPDAAFITGSDIRVDGGSVAATVR